MEGWKTGVEEFRPYLPMSPHNPHFQICLLEALRLEKRRRTRRLQKGGQALVLSNYTHLLQLWFNIFRTMSDSDVSLPSGDPDKYWWIGGDHPYIFPAEVWDHKDDLPEPSHDASAATSNDGSSAFNSRVLELEDLTRELQGRIHKLEVAGQRHEEELTSTAASMMPWLKGFHHCAPTFARNGWRKLLARLGSRNSTSTCASPLQ